MVRDEAVSVCLHDGNRVTLRRLVNWLCMPVALFIVKVGQEDTSGALARHFTQVNVEGESATEIGVVDEGPFCRVVPLYVVNEGSVVLTDSEAGVLGLEILTIKALHIEVEPIAILRLVPLLNVGGECLPLGRLWPIIIITITIVIVSLFVLTVGPNVEAVD